MNYLNEIERIRAEVARLNKEIRKTRKRIVRMKINIALAVAIEIIKQMPSAIVKRLETIEEYVASRGKLSELESERVALDAQCKQRFCEIILEAEQDRE